MQPTSQARDLKWQLDHEEWGNQLRELSAAVSCLPELFVAEEPPPVRPSRGDKDERQRRLLALSERIAAMAAWHERKAQMLTRAAERVQAELPEGSGSRSARLG